MAKKKSKLFVYGSLRDRSIFKSISGLNFTRKFSKADEKTLYAELALLDRHRKVSPDNVYYYAVSEPNSKIEGFLIHDIPASAMAEIDHYEGKRYQRQRVNINTANGPVWAEAYLVSHESMTEHFGDRFHVNLIHELWLRKRIDKFLKKRVRPGERTADAESERRANRELLATTERDLVMSHYHSDAVSDYYLEHELDRPRPGIKHLYEDKKAESFVNNYLALAIKQVLFNQLEDKIQSRYRFELEHIRSSERYFKRSVSALIALRSINLNTPAVDMIVQEGLKTLHYPKHDLIDYVKYAVNAAKSLFDVRVVMSNLNRVRANFHPGIIPLGAELELSNLGPNAITKKKPSASRVEPIYDNFRYFYDFRLDILSWKLGGYIDDHSGSTDLARRTGFLELAPGRLNVAGELSRPATADPWLLNQLIHEITLFYDVKPHSLHLSFQLLKHQIGKQKVLPLGFVKCLLVLGGGLQQKNTGRLWISRMGYDEITQHEYGEELVFARTDKRKWYLGNDELATKIPKQAMTHVQQYKFIRLDRRADYEPLIMCLKGLQTAYNPGDYLNAKQLKTNKKLRTEYEHLKKWALEPQQISSQTISRFVTAVYDGLMNERHRKPAHRLHYIDWAVSAIDIQLRLFNKELKKTLT